MKNKFSSVHRGFMCQTKLADLHAKTCKHTLACKQMFTHPVTSCQNVNKSKSAAILLIWFTTANNVCASAPVTTKTVY